MIRFIAVLVLFTSGVFAYSHQDVIKDYSAGNYKEVCAKSVYLFKGEERNEDILSLIGDACAKVDYINPLGHIIRRLVSTPQYRENASYFATLILQKKLIYQFMNDGIDLKNLRLPKSEHILSIVFENLVQKNYTTLENKKLQIKTDTKEYIIWLSTDDEQEVVHVDEYKDAQIVKRHWYL